MSRVLGRGSYGCIISPAIVFDDDSDVTSRNRRQFVTKIASNAPDEYERCMRVLDRMGPSFRSVAILPVGPLHCVGSSDFGDLEDLIEPCDAILEFRLTRPKAEEPLCAIQFPKFEKTLEDLPQQDFESLWPFIDACFGILQEMHHHNVYHLDVKEANVTSDGKFLDWGLSRTLRNWTEADESMSFQVSKPQFRDYYIDLASDFFRIASSDGIWPSFKPTYRASDSLFDYINFNFKRLQSQKIRGPGIRNVQSFLGLLDVVCLAGLAVRCCRQKVRMARALYDRIRPFQDDPFPFGDPETLPKDPDYD